MPERHRQARQATEQVLVNEAAARRWLERAGHEPWAVVRLFTFLDGAFFWAFVLPGLFLPLGLCLSTTMVPAVLAKVLRYRIVDVWADTTQGALSVGPPFGVLAVGLLIAGFAKKRGVTQAGLHAALGARAPSTEGGVWGCRSCGAPLAVAANAFSARCDYCDCDNLVRLPEAWLAEVRKRRDRLAEVVRTAEKDWRALRSSLRTSLILRAVFGLGLLAVVTVPILGARPTFESLSTFDVTKPPNLMPSWDDHRRSQATSECTPDRLSAYLYAKGPCSDAHGCHFYALESPLAGETIEVQGRVLPAGTVLSLEPRVMRFLDSTWAPAPEMTTTSDAQLVQFPVSEGGWYRLHLTVPGTSEGELLRFCVRTKR